MEQLESSLVLQPKTPLHSTSPHFAQFFDQYAILVLWCECAIGRADEQTRARDQVAAARDRLAMQHHPDKGGTNGEMAAINLAYAEALKEQ